MAQVVIIGSGAVAEAIGLALKSAGVAPIQIFARNRERGQVVAQLCGCEHESNPELLARADLYIVAVLDRAIAGLLSLLDFGDGVVAHTAGGVDIAIFGAQKSDVGVIYPLQSFTEGHKVAFNQTPLLIESRGERGGEVIRGVAELLSSRVVELDSEKRLVVHTAAVFANNFSNYMYTIAEELVLGVGLDFSVLKPLIKETAEKAIGANSPKEVQTGPAIRGDFETKDRHYGVLATRKDLASLYVNISNGIWEISKKTSPK